MVERRVRVIAHARMQRAGLNERAARRREPMEALRLAHRGERRDLEGPGGDGLEEAELLADRRDVALRADDAQRLAVDGGPGAEVLARAAEEDQPGIEELLALDVGHDPNDGIGERATRRRHAGPRCERDRPRRPTFLVPRDGGSDSGRRRLARPAGRRTGHRSTSRPGWPR